MKICLTKISVYTYIALSSLAIASTLAVRGDTPKDIPELNDAFRSDSILRFLRRRTTSHQKSRQPGVETAAKDAPKQEGPLAPIEDKWKEAQKDARRGPNYKDKEAHSAAKEVQENAPKQKDPLASAKDTLEGAQEDAQQDFEDAQKGPNYKDKEAQAAAKKAKVVAKKAAKNQEQRLDPSEHANDAFEDAQRGPNYKDKKAQKAAEKVMDNAPKQRKPPNPIESAGKAAEDADEAAGKQIKPGNPIESIGKAAEDADKAAGKAIQDGDNPMDALGDAVEEADKDVGRAIAGKRNRREGEPKKQPSLERDTKSEETPLVPGCKNSPKGWTDRKGRDCNDYAEGEWCTETGHYGDGWLDEWGSFEDVAKDGKEATQACCVCGGGVHEVPFDAPSPGPSAAASPMPAPAPVPAPAPGIDYTMINRPLQEQGFHGKLVMHADQETMVSDWGREFGPHSLGNKNIRQICLDHPGNEWCLKNGYYKNAAHSFNLIAIGSAVLLACL
jgi:hypothetical protein